MGKIAIEQPTLFYHWRMGLKPSTGQ